VKGKSKPKKRQGRFEADTFDKGFVIVIDELQKIGYCKNIKKLEEFLDFPYNTLYQVLNGSRGIPLNKRDKVLKFFIGRYDINPQVFSNLTANVFKNDPPEVAENAETYVKVKDHFSNNRLTVGDMREFEMMKNEMERLKKAIGDRDNIIRNLQTQVNSMQRLIDKLSK
jgi:hypothetical protein